MSEAKKPSPLAVLPSVDAVLRDEAFQEASAGLTEAVRTRLVRQVIERHRQRLLDANGEVSVEAGRIPKTVIEACAEEAEAAQQPFPRRVVNGTGVLIHTNLGRAPLGRAAQRLDAAALAGYSTLEWDAATQQRGSRDAPMQQRLRLLTGAEAALVVNNCAAALFLALAALGAEKDVLVSRSELVEIGGSFRVPDIMAASSARLREVGTTNKTRRADYERAATPGDSVLLKVHQANFVQRGFVEQVPVTDLVALGERLDVPVIEDNGSGLVADEPAPLLADEPRVLESLAQGVDVICHSADKLFGGIQAGIVLGKKRYVEVLRRHPLYRVLRLDKVRLALLDQTLRQYLAGHADELPLWRLFHATPEDLRERAEQLELPGPEARWTQCALVPLEARLGGGSNPEQTFASLGLELAHRDHSAEALKRRFARRAVPIAGYVREEQFYLDLRTLFPDDYAEVQAALDELR